MRGREREREGGGGGDKSVRWGKGEWWCLNEMIEDRGRSDMIALQQDDGQLCEQPSQ